MGGSPVGLSPEPAGSDASPGRGCQNQADCRTPAGAEGLPGGGGSPLPFPPRHIVELVTGIIKRPSAKMGKRLTTHITKENRRHTHP